MSLLTSLIRANPGGAQWPFLQTIDPLSGTAGSIVSGTLYGGLVMVDKPTPITTMAYFVGTASGNVDLGIYTYDGTTWTKVASTGNTAAAGSSAVQDIALTAVYTLQPGVQYYFVFSADNSTITAWRTSTLTLINYRSRAITKATANNPLPASFTTPAAASGALIWLAGR